jgi:FkbM family methyltransferase
VFGYHSQYGQDLLVDVAVFGRKRGGTFVDIGAHDGRFVSNSLFLETHRDWTGVCVEPNPRPFRELQRRRRAHALNAAIADRAETMQFVQVEGYGEPFSGLDPGEERMRRIAETIAEHGGSHQMIEVEALPFSALVDRYALEEVDYLSIDTEGGELAILEAIDFDRVPIRVVGIENDSHDDRIERLLLAAGFSRLVRVRGDDLWIKDPTWAMRARAFLLLPAIFAAIALRRGRQR